MYQSLEILGLRGFASAQQIKFAPATGDAGSGLTTIVGANNSGKSTVIEALRALTQNQPPTFTEGRRNRAAGDRVKLTLMRIDGNFVSVESEYVGTSQTKRTPEDSQVRAEDVFVLPSRRVFDPYFGQGGSERQNYMQQIGFPASRSSSLGQFTNRLFTIHKNRAAFDEVLRKVVDPVPEWSIDQRDTGEYYLKMKRGDVTHTSEGLGEGLVSLLYLIDALYDSKPGQLIAVDEPELSLHPALQRKLANLFADYAKDRQIVCSTHSPYFVNLGALGIGATVARVHLDGGRSKISQLSDATAKSMAALMKDENNPHVLGLNAQEVFFLDDKVILVEGQEDVVFFRKVEASVNESLNGSIFGWGVGGADKMARIAKLLSELGFQRVLGILDANKAHLIPDLQWSFPKYRFIAIPADDVRTKTEAKARPAIAGLLDDANESVRAELKDQTRQLFVEANKYLNS